MKNNGLRIKVYLKWAVGSYLLAFLIITSCSNPFAPAEADGSRSGSILLTEQKTPEEVLQNFQFSYTFKDSLVYSELLDSTFIFLSTDFNESPPVPIVWNRDQELRTAGKMLRFFNTLDLTFNLISSSVAETDSEGEPTRIDHRLTFTLTLDGGTQIPTLIGRVIFTYVRRGERWLISRWEEPL